MDQKPGTIERLFAQYALHADLGRDAFGNFPINMAGELKQYNKKFIHFVYELILFGVFGVNAERFLPKK